MKPPFPVTLACDAQTATSKCGQAGCRSSADCAAGYVCDTGGTNRCLFACGPQNGNRACPSGYTCTNAGRCAIGSGPALAEPYVCANNTCTLGCDPTGSNPNNGVGCPAGSTCSAQGTCVGASGPLVGYGRAQGCLNQCSLYTADSAISFSDEGAAQQARCTADPFCRWDQSQVTPGAQNTTDVESGACLMKYPINDCQPCKRYLRAQDALRGHSGANQLVGFGQVGPVYAIVRDKGVPGFGPVIANTGATDACNGGSITWGRGDGEAYRGLAQSTLGRTQDICAQSYDSFLQLVTSDIAILSHPYPLSAAPIAATLQVGLSRPNGDGTVSFVAVPRSRTSGFFYDATGNGIGFKSDPVDGQCASGAGCSADGAIDASEIAYARTAPQVPRAGDTIYVSYRLWEPVPCGGPCPSGETCARVVCTDQNQGYGCQVDTDCSPGHVCQNGSCTLTCSPGSLIDACVASPSCGRCQTYNPATKSCQNVANACACNPGSGQSCNPGAVNSCPTGWGCDETCVCDPLPSCAPGTFQSDGTVSSCPAALSCCQGLAADTQARQTACAAHSTQASCTADTAHGCSYGSGGPCHYPFARYQSCCPEGVTPQCFTDSESGVSSISCVNSSCDCTVCYNMNPPMECDVNANCACYLNPG